MSVELVRRMVAAGLVGEREFRSTLLRHVNGRLSLVGLLLASGQVSDAALERAVDAGPPLNLPLVVDRELLAELPTGLCAFFLAVPLFDDSSVVTFACADPSDAHAVAELGFHVGGEVRLRHAPPESIASALREAGLSTSQLPPPNDPRGTTDRPLLLVSRTSRAARLAKGGAVVDEQGRSAAPLASKVPRAPALPHFPARKAGARRGRSESSPPLTERGPFVAGAPQAPLASVDTVLEAMRLAQNRDEIIDCLLVGMDSVARRVAVFAVRKQGFRGIGCSAAISSALQLRELEVPLRSPTVLAIAASNGTYLGPLPATAAHASMREVLGDCAEEVVTCAVRVAGRPAVVLFADELRDSQLALERSAILAAAAGDALSRILASAKSAGRGAP